MIPQQIKEYLQEKSEYRNIWNQLVPNYFSTQEFCDFVNQIRGERISETEKIQKKIKELGLKNNKNEQDVSKIEALKAKKNAIFPDILKQMCITKIYPKIKNTSVSLKEVNQLIGSLANVNRVKKEEIQEITEIVNNHLYENITLDTYEDEILLIMDDLINEFFTKNEIGNTISDGEKRGFGEQAWNIFLVNHKEEIRT